MVLNPRAARRPGGPPGVRTLLHVLAAAPLAGLAWTAAHDGLGADPVAALSHETGQWALRLLLASLAITPLRRLTGRPQWLRYRRLLGLWAFAYACTHLLVYLVLDLGDHWSQALAEIAKRPYLTVGFAAWLLLLPLAVTSTRAAMRRLGRGWSRLHRLVYPAAGLAVLHHAWGVKADLSGPALYAGVLIVLLLLRGRRSGSQALTAGPG